MPEPTEMGVVKSVTDADVIIVGAGPTGLMLAGELGLAGVRVLVLERLPRPSESAKAGGLSGQILELLRYRGLLERFEAASTGP
ncbi:MAG: FAD-dependent oxidoreductase, partial [Solirubrobacteraceae bacterium]